jgi:uncharacterized protein YifN (PemK superfamily)
MGSLLLCNFDQGFRAPEMVKRRLVAVVSPRMKGRPGLCTVVSLSTTPPNPVLGFHCQIDIRPMLPLPLASDGIWVKGDMVYAVGLHRLDFLRTGKDRDGSRLYYFNTLSHENMTRIRHCLLHGLGMAALTRHLA